ncbi:MAG: 1-(5-phosphoribosyl)-5-[(5-phosphoribosylamino)methylideneamino]imidazole-4-carboxamide isomerase [Dysgonamonadaceae bacterium]|jgi:phosphoribosylformimino-5-aminoimidazole carboxamide ribotide isomerase|nr:1-(5-phosphoribosyl)-5-[(5-phosphoribosylamino)methylideneamino]imidazole-4-carboxamide isomerase [Dysgonamonadaceae bacterium]
MIEIIPAIDIIEGKAVRLSQGNYEQKKVYNEDPLEVAKMFEDHGINRLHLVDLDGAKANRIINYHVLAKIASRTSLIIDFGGGLKSDSDLDIAFDNGAEMVTGGSIAVKNPEIFQRWIDKFGAEHIILGADCKNKKIAVAGWTETTNEDMIPFIETWRQQSIYKVICTDVSRDGMLTGPNIDLYREIKEADPCNYLIASGGISCIEDIEHLEEAHIQGVIIGKAIYEGKIRLKDLADIVDNSTAEIKHTLR